METGLPPVNSAGTGRVFSVPPGAPFLETLARSLLDGTLIEGFRPLDDPLLLASATLYLPTRRAARAFSVALIEASGSGAVLLPTIRTLGDADDEEIELGLADAAEAEIGEAIGDLHRRLALSRYVAGWASAMSAEARELYGDEDIVIPSSAAEAIRLAGDLAALLDAMETEEIGWDRLPDLVRETLGPGEEPGPWAAWWSVTLRFLGIVSDTWPQYLREIERVDPSQRRRLLLDARTARLARRIASGPVIAAGSTGSIPATARLIAAIAAQPRGAVVLPGLDMDLPEPVWQALGRPDSEDSSLTRSTHPQYGLARLLRSLRIDRSDVRSLAAPERSQRMRLIGAALLPADQTGQWALLEMAAEQKAAAVGGIAVIEAANEREEALAIAVALREVLERPGQIGALVTPDRLLARRVATEMLRFGIAVADSGGIPLARTGLARLARAIARLGTGRPDPVLLTFLLKHEAVSGPDDGRDQMLARLFELAVLRGAISVPPVEALGEAARARHATPVRFAPADVDAMTPGDWEDMIALADRVASAFESFAVLRQRTRTAGAVPPGDGRVDPGACMAALLAALSQITAVHRGPALWAMDGGPELASLFRQFEEGGEASLSIGLDEFPDVLDALIADTNVRPALPAHPRLFIWGPLEARLQRADRIILGSLNEGSWPAASRNDAFLNRPMKARIGLSLPERRIGQAAHDYQQMSGAREIIYARSLKAGNAPTVASRWLQRLEVACGEPGRSAMRARGARYLELARGLDRPESRAPRSPRPAPCPPLELRPTRLSVTEIETWIRDPYVIHARHILGLSPLEPLEREADPLLKGQLYHAILARFSTEEREKDEVARMMRIATQAFAEEKLPPETLALWLPRFETIARLFIAWDGARADQVRHSWIEAPGRIEVGTTGFTLTGRADRIDRLESGGLVIIDYKTGSGPSVKQARRLSPQLALEARMAQAGAFATIPAGLPIDDLAYVRLRSGDELAVDSICGGKKPVDPAELADRAWEQLVRHIHAYRNPRQGYLSRYAPMFEAEMQGSYDHLARVREWSTGEEEAGDE